MNLELMKAGYPPIDIKFADGISYYNAFDEYLPIIKGAIDRAIKIEQLRKILFYFSKNLPGGVVVPGMYHGKDGAADRSTWQRLMNVSDDARQKMFDDVKREFIQESGMSPMAIPQKGPVFHPDRN